ncbi:MAG TPA: UDP-N-acetylglucosamine 2-epimerase (non-hydrolyzing) [Iamia sp.]|nr:UDP-N-acetylglucosamine 2-epimerase (non-hydrolyzing) [Iamia sp.]
MTQHPILVVAGTRPEAVKLAPVALALQDASDLRPVLVATGQHPDLTDEALATFGLEADHHLDLPRRRTGSQAGLMAHLLPELERCAAAVGPAAVVVQGDTASALAGALTGFWGSTPVVHVEAGLRTGSLAEPFPEEGYRRLITRVATAHLAPTRAAVDALIAEGVDPRSVMCTGNTVVDAALLCSRLHTRLAIPGLHPTGRGRLALVTVHRRESWGEPLRRILRGVRDLLADERDLRVVLPVHPNPAVRDVVTEELADHPRVVLTEPLPYAQLIALLARVDVVLTDSGGIQEEAPTFGTPVVVLRDATERPEAVRAGTAWLVGADAAVIRHRTRALLAHPGPVATTNPFGDGQAAARVVAAVRAVVAGRPLPAGWDPPPVTAARRAPRPARSPLPARSRAVLTGWDRAVPVVPRGRGVTRIDGPAPRPTPAATGDATAAPEPDAAPEWVHRLERTGAPRDAGPAPDLRPVLSPPEPTTTTRDPDGPLGGVVEVRRGAQVLRHLPGLALDLLDPADGHEPWHWRARQEEGPVWVETATPQIELRVPGGRVVVRGGAVSSQRDATRDTTTITVIAGRAEVRADRGDAVGLGPRQCTTVHPLGTLGGTGAVAPADLDADPWVRANRALSHARPPGGRLATDPLVVLADARPGAGRGRRLPTRPNG